MWRLCMLAILFGCASRAPSAATPASSSTHKSALVPPGTAKVGDRTWCMVSEEEFTVMPDSPKVEHDGKTYYFCCAGCDKDFAKSPERFLARTNARR